jgi:hypothetical protein
MHSAPYRQLQSASISADLPVLVLVVLLLQVDTTGLALQEGQAVAASATRHLLGELAS